MHIFRWLYNFQCIESLYLTVLPPSLVPRTYSDSQVTDTFNITPLRRFRKISTIGSDHSGE